VPSSYQTTTRRPLRRDARENRDRILIAARTAFAEQGIDASIDEIAAGAGVGVGTLYRRFPTKEALVDAVFETHLEQIVVAAEEALGGNDGWTAFVGYLTHVVGLQASDRGLAEILGSQLPSEHLLAQARIRLRPLVAQLIARAQEEGGLRDDVVYEDVSVLLWATGRVVAATRDVQPLFWQRYLALLVDGLRAHRAAPLPQPPLTPATHGEAMLRFTGQRGRSG
jgi:AcrR family transcriptional regulator